MNITTRIKALKDNQSKFNRSEFKVMFALAASAKPLTLDGLSAQTGISVKQLDAAIYGLVKHNFITHRPNEFSYNDLTPWDTAGLFNRVLYQTKP